MIKAILPVPVRLYQPGTILVGANWESYWIQGMTRNEVTFGRDIVIPPLAFYKVYSYWGGYLLEHTFVSDHTLNPTDLMKHRDIYTGRVYSTPPVFVPISVKYGKPGTVTETYLFTKCIDFLLTNYRHGYPISSSQSVILPGAHPVVPPSPDRIPRNTYYGVYGIIEYIDTLLHIALRLQIDVDYDRWAPPAIPYEIRDRVTPERPATVVRVLTELLYYETNQDALFDYVDDLIGLETCQDARTLPRLETTYLTEFLYRGPYDPITAVCLSTPSFITLDQLIPYIGDMDELCKYFQMACIDAKQSETFDCLCMIDHINGLFDELELESILEFFYACSYTDVTIHLKSAVSDPIFVPYDRFGLYQYSSEAENCYDQINYSILSDLMKKLFMDPRKAIPYDELVLSKNWLGELIINGIQNRPEGQICTKYYLNLNLYHLISPCLVNRERLEVIDGFRYNV